MKRLAVTSSSCSCAAVGGRGFGWPRATGEAGTEATAAKPKLPALPAEVKSRGKWQIGVKCDTPPFGYQDTSGDNRGYDVEIARQFAQWAFGEVDRVEFTCVTTASRIPTLTSGRVDIIISTITWTAAREQQIDFSLPYYGAIGRLLVPNSTRSARSRLDARQDDRLDVRLDLQPLDHQLLQGHDVPGRLEPERAACSP